MVQLARYASIILDIPVQGIGDAYTYSIPENLHGVEVGCAVLVSFRNRPAIGFVCSISSVLEDMPISFSSSRTTKDQVKPVGSLFDDFECDQVAQTSDDRSKNIKPVERVISSSLFEGFAVDCARYISRTYIAPLSSCMRLFMPPGGVPELKRSGGEWIVNEPNIGPVDDRWVKLTEKAQGYTPRVNAHKEIRILEALSKGELRVAELALEFGSVDSSIRALEKKGIIEVARRRRHRHHELATVVDKNSHQFKKSAKAPVLTREQQIGLDAITVAQDRKDGSVVVVDGVTGSGKTELYLQAIEKTLSEGKGAIVLVPEISLTPQTVARFRGRFGDSVAVLHSKMGKGERYDQWESIRAGQSQVVVGARGALFSPIKDLGLIVIDEEHETSYKQDKTPRYVSRDVATWMVTQKHATLILGSATPSFEALYRCEQNEKWECVKLYDRVNGRALPAIEVVDMAAEFGSGQRSMFSGKLKKMLIETIEAGQKSVLLLNQRGFSRFLLCRSCGYVPMCISCDTSLTYHEAEQKLVCHHCGYTEDVPAICPECGSPYLKKFGAGTQRVEVELKEILDDYDVRIIRMDADTTSRKGAHQKLLDEFSLPGAAVLLGTQMIAKGLDFDDVVLVGVINADTMLKIPDFRSSEKTFDLIEQVAGRAGRAELDGRVVVQTYLADAPAIQAASRYDRTSFLSEELEKRKLLHYPPYIRLINVLVKGENEEKVKNTAQEISEELQKTIEKTGNAEWSHLPATPCVIPRMKDQYRYNILIKVPLESDISVVFDPILKAQKANKDVLTSIDVDPYDLM